MKPRVNRLAIAMIVALLALATAGVGIARAGLAPDWKVGEPAQWLVENTRSFAMVSTEKTRLSVPGLGKAGLVIEIPSSQCSGTGEIKGAPVETPGIKRKVALSCTGATVSKPSNCTVQSVGQKTAGSIVFNSLKSTLVWLTSGTEEAADLISPETGTTLTSLEFAGASCELMANPYAVNGQIATPFTPVTEMTKAATQRFPAAAVSEWWNNAATREKQTVSQLTTGGKNATLQSSFTVTLNPVEAFGIFGG